MPFRSLIVVFVILTLWITACGTEIHQGVAPSETLPTVPVTLSATAPPPPTETPVPPPPQPTLPPVQGTTSTQVNVRAEPSTAGKVLGILPPNTVVEITGKDPGKSWWQINYPQGIEGKGWVTAQYVTTANGSDVPVIGGMEANPNGGIVAVVQQQLNVRSGPGTSFNSLGTLNPQDVVSLIGKDPNGGWLQINFTNGPEGKGWINAAFVRAQGVENVPIITEAGQVVGTGTPTLVPPTPTATVLPAREDHDSAESPIASVVFEPSGTQTLIYRGDLSSPEGDAEDWIAFKPYAPAVYVILDCQGSGYLKVEVSENALPTDIALPCTTSMKQIRVHAGSNYIVHLLAAPPASGLQYTSYTLTIKMRP